MDILHKIDFTPWQKKLTTPFWPMRPWLSLSVALYSLRLRHRGSERDWIIIDGIYLGKKVLSGCWKGREGEEGGGQIV